MISSNPIASIDVLLNSRGVRDYEMGFFSVPIIGPSFTTPAFRGWYFLVSSDLPSGLEIISETHALHVGTTQNGLLQEFTGQMLIIIPEGATLDRLDFVRIIPKTLPNE